MAVGHDRSNHIVLHMPAQPATRTLVVACICALPGASPSALAAFHQPAVPPGRPNLARIELFRAGRLLLVVAICSLGWRIFETVVSLDPREATKPLAHLGS